MSNCEEVLRITIKLEAVTAEPERIGTSTANRPRKIEKNPVIIDESAHTWLFCADDAEHADHYFN